MFDCYPSCQTTCMLLASVSNDFCKDTFLKNSFSELIYYKKISVDGPTIAQSSSVQAVLWEKETLRTPASGKIKSDTITHYPEHIFDGFAIYCRKSRNLSEKKRRDQFNILVNELSAMVTNNKKMDKTSVIKTAIQVIQANKGTSAHFFTLCMF